MVSWHILSASLNFAHPTFLGRTRKIGSVVPTTILLDNSTTGCYGLINNNNNRDNGILDNQGGKYSSGGGGGGLVYSDIVLGGGNGLRGVRDRRSSTGSSSISSSSSGGTRKSSNCSISSVESMVIRGNEDDQLSTDGRSVLNREYLSCTNYFHAS